MKQMLNYKAGQGISMAEKKTVQNFIFPVYIFIDIIFLSISINDCTC